MDHYPTFVYIIRLYTITHTHIPTLYLLLGINNNLLFEKGMVPNVNAIYKSERKV